MLGTTMKNYLNKAPHKHYLESYRENTFNDKAIDQCFTLQPKTCHKEKISASKEMCIRDRFGFDSCMQLMIVNT